MASLWHGPFLEGVGGISYASFNLISSIRSQAPFFQVKIKRGNKGKSMD